MMPLLTLSSYECVDAQTTATKKVCFLRRPTWVIIVCCFTLLELTLYCYSFAFRPPRSRRLPRRRRRRPKRPSQPRRLLRRPRVRPRRPRKRPKPPLRRRPRPPRPRRRPRRRRPPRRQPRKKTRSKPGRGTRHIDVTSAVDHNVYQNIR